MEYTTLLVDIDGTFLDFLSLIHISGGNCGKVAVVFD